MKNLKFHSRENCRNSPKIVKKCFLILTLIGFLFFISINLVSAMDWDNVINYEKDDKVAVFDNALGFGDTIARAEIITPIKNHQVIRGEDRKVIIYNIENYDKEYINGFKDVEITDLKTGREIDKDFHYEYAIYDIRTVDNNEYSCNEKELVNKSLEITCGYNKVGTYEEEYIKEWKRLENTNIPSGNTTIALVTDVFPGDNMDGVFIMFGKKISRHASWNETFDKDLLVYYRFNETTGTNVLDSNTSAYNGSIVGAGSSWIADGISENALFIQPNVDVQINHTALEDTMNHNNTGFSIGGWVRFNVTGGAQQGIWVLKDVNGDSIVYVGAAEVFGIDMGGGAGASAAQVVAGTWYHVILTYDRATVAGLYNTTLWVNGTSVYNYNWSVTDGVAVGLALGGQMGATSNQMNGTLDEFAIWNRTLSQVEVEDLYNSGVGIFLSPPGLPLELIVTLGEPNNTETISTPKQFFGNFSLPNGNLTNSTLFVWHSNGTIFNTNVTTGLNGTTNSTNVFLSGLPVGDNFTFNYLGCGINVTDSICNFAPVNNSFNISQFQINSQTFTNETIEGSVETFSINITLGSGQSIDSVKFIYNNSVKDVVIISNGNEILTSIFNIPSVFTQTNNTFFWNIILASGESNTTLNNQSVLNLGIDDCSSFTTLILNYTLKDEEKNLFLNETDFNTTIEIDVDVSPIGTTTPIIEFSNNYSKINPAQVCLENPLNASKFRMDVQTRYQAQTYVSEFHHLQNFTLDNSTIPENVNLLDLLITDSQEFKIIFKDDNFIPVENALIDITRKYVSEGLFRTVEVIKTDDEGESLGHLVLSDVIYTMIVTKDGVILGTFNNVIAFCDNVAIGDCVIPLNTFVSRVPTQDWVNFGGVSLHPNFDEDSRVITISFTSADGSSKFVELNTSKYDRFGNNTVCSDKLVSSSGTLTCTIPLSFGNVSVVSQVFVDENPIKTYTFKIVQDPRDIFGGEGIMMTLITVMAMTLLFIANPILLIIGAILGLIIAGSVGYFVAGTITTAGSALIWIIVAAAIIIYKISERGGT